MNRLPNLRSWFVKGTNNLEINLAKLYFGYMGVMIGIGVLGDIGRNRLLLQIAFLMGMSFLTIMGVLIVGGVVIALGYAVWSWCRKVAQ